MFSRISHRFATLIVILIGVGVVPAQNQNPPVDCPSITVSADEIAIPSRGEPVGHTLKGLENYSGRGLTISWKLATPLFDPATVKIDGQGTAHSSFIFPVDVKSGTMTMTASVAGLPVGCPNTASESVAWDGAPDAVKVGEIKNIDTPDAVLIKQFAAELKNNPNNQGYVFVGHPAGTSKRKMLARERKFADVLSAMLEDHDGSRITLVQIPNSADFAEFWRVPPGADDPTCESCK